MTPDPHQPQKEYIITEEMVQCIETWTERYPIVSKDIADCIRSRPAPASTTAPAGCPYWDPEKNYDDDDPENHCSCKFSTIKADAARQAREQVLDIIRKTDACCCPHELCHSGEGHDGLNCRDCLIKFIEDTLRSQQ